MTCGSDLNTLLLFRSLLLPSPFRFPAGSNYDRKLIVTKIGIGIIVTDHIIVIPNQRSIEIAIFHVQIMTKNCATKPLIDTKMKKILIAISN